MKNTNLIPIEDNIVVKAHNAETTTAAGIYIPESAKDSPQKGTVIAVGPGIKDEPMVLEAGYNVYFKMYAGNEIKIDGQSYLFMKQKDVYSIING